MALAEARMSLRQGGIRPERTARPGTGVLFPSRTALSGPVTRARQARSTAAYACVFLLSLGLMTMSARPDLAALGLGLIAPGGGFLAWSGPGNPIQVLAIGLFAASLLLFLAAVVIWFATGNVLLPVAVWLLAALGAASIGVGPWGGAQEAIWQPARQVVPLAVALGLGLAFGAARHAGLAGLRRRRRLNAHLRSVAARAAPAGRNRDGIGDELSREDLQLVRLLLDRALQPVEAFEGFEWVDQFQTAAVRYQLNFMSYALSMAQAVHLPACRAYFHTAQKNLIAKQQNHRIWRYWRAENLWGNLRMGADPIPRDNIMLSGFLAAQIAYYQSASGERPCHAPGSLRFKHPSGAHYAYSLPALIDVLAGGYRSADFGLLACEPNWVYPLCNLITATAIRAEDAATGSHRWEEIAETFRLGLETEFVTAGGRLVPCRSSYTGFAVPPIGGAVMQAFPCLFLNAVLPDIAQRQWLVLRHDLAGRDWRRALWPIDVGNYRFSRASSYAATAAAAVELGDTETARRALQHLDEDCPLRACGSVAHRSKASLWAHAVELMARCGRAGALRSLVMAPRSPASAGAFIKDARYPDLLVAKAVNTSDGLSAVLYPGERAGPKTVTIGGLAPGQSYRAVAADERRFTADPAGNARLDLPVDGRTEFLVTRTT